MRYRIEQEPGRDSFGNYRYRIYKEGVLVAHYWHDYRGDEHGIDFVTGLSDQWPVGRMTDFLFGSTLSERSAAYMDQRT